MKKIKIKCKLIDTDDGGYFVFAPCIYSFHKNNISFGLELFGRRFLYTSITREKK